MNSTETSEVQEDFRSVLVRAAEKYVEDRVRREIHTGGNSPWYYWQLDRIKKGQPLDTNLRRRFNEFLGESAPPVQTGLCHLHAFYEKRNGDIYWKVVSRKTSICKIPGRCKRAMIMVEDPEI